MYQSPYAVLCRAVPCSCRYDFAEWLSSRMMMQLSNEAGQSQVSAAEQQGDTTTQPAALLVFATCCYS